MEIAISQKLVRVPVTIMKVSGPVDSSNYQDFSEAARSAIADGAQYLLLDLSDCNYMSSAGIRSLNEIYLYFKKSHPDSHNKITRSPHVKLLNPSEKIASVLSLSGVDAFFEIHNDMETAVASF